MSAYTPKFHPTAVSDGIDLRDWFAGQCDPSVYHPIGTLERKTGRTPTIAELAEYIAEIRLIEADAMLAARVREVIEGGGA